MSKPQTPPPVVLQLATLPREQLGPFLLLGVDKAVDKEQIEAAWAQRLIWARKNQIATPLEDINWARETLANPDRRIQADAASLNVDTSDGLLRRLRERYSTDGGGCRPLDVEKNLADYAPPVEAPDVDEVRKAIVVGEVPLEIPAVASIIGQFVQEALDPWDESVNKIGSPPAG